MKHGMTVAFTGFMLEQFACGLGMLALFANLDKGTGIALTAGVGLLASAGLALVTVGAILHHRAASNG